MIFKGKDFEILQCYEEFGPGVRFAGEDGETITIVFSNAMLGDLNRALPKLERLTHENKDDGRFPVNILDGLHMPEKLENQFYNTLSRIGRNV